MQTHITALRIDVVMDFLLKLTQPDMQTCTYGFLRFEYFCMLFKGEAQQPPPRGQPNQWQDKWKTQWRRKELGREQL